MTLKKQAGLALALIIVSLLAVLVSHLALTEIYRGQGDLRREWNVLRFCLAAIVTVQVFAVATFWRVIKGNGGC